MNIPFVLKNFIMCRGDIKRFTQNCVMSLDYAGYLSIPKADIPVLISNAGKRYDSRTFSTIIFTQVISDYDFSDLRGSDIVLDIGANRGYFSLEIMDKACKIYAVEPLFVSELEKNISLNNAQNKITILPYALSDKMINIEFQGKTTLATGKTLSELKDMCGGHVDFLKCDCEGGEWIIKPGELDGIRRIEIEVHSFNGEHLYNFVDMLKSVGYRVNIDDEGKQLLIHAFKNL